MNKITKNRQLFKVVLLTIVMVCCVVSWVYSQENDAQENVEKALDEYELTAVDEYLDYKIDVIEAKNEDIHDVLESLSQKGRLNIIIGPDITGKVTIFLKDIYARDALRIILDSNKLAYSEENGIIRVMTAQGFEERYGYPFTQKMQTKMIPLLHATAVDMIEVLNQMKSESGRIIFNDQTQTFILIDVAEKLTAMDTYIKKTDVPIDRLTIELKYIEPQVAAKEIKALLTENKGDVQIDKEKKSITIIDTLTKIREVQSKIEKLDLPERQVIFDTKVLQIILNDEHTKGVDWEAIVSDYKSLEFLGLKNSIVGKNGAISLGTVSSEDYKVLLEALETVGDISHLDDSSNKTPKQKSAVLSVNGLDAVNLSNQKSSQETKDREEDLRLYLKPIDYIDGIVEVHIKPEVFSLAEKTTNLKVKDGSTIVIGGLFKNVTVQTERKIPLISDIPLIRDVPFEEIPFLGFAFRNQKKSIRKTEIIVFVTTKTEEEK